MLHQSKTKETFHVTGKKEKRKEECREAALLKLEKSPPLTVLSWDARDSTLPYSKLNTSNHANWLSDCHMPGVCPQVTGYLGATASAII